MEAVFLKLLNMSISASWLVGAVLLVRVFLKNGPKWVRCLLWGIVALRLLCPFSLQSVLSLIPSAETVPPEILYQREPQIHTGIPALNSAVNPVITQSFAPELGASVNPLQIVTAISAAVWVMGMVVMALYALISYLVLRYRTRESVPAEPGVRICDRIPEPFILGVFKPVIFLPDGMADADARCVIAHERAHLARRDHWWKPVGFLLLTVYWFNPVMWLAYYLLCRDIELACDEKVVARMDEESRKAYSHALINCSTPGRWITACPLAFGEVGVKARIKSVLNYKKPAVWIVAACMVLCAVVAVCFLTDPKTQTVKVPELTAQSGDSEALGTGMRITDMEQRGDTVQFTVRWNNMSGDEITFGESFSLRYMDEPYIDLTEDMVFHAIAYSLKPGNSVEVASYAVPASMLERQGAYRMESSFTCQGQTYSAWVDFTLGEGALGNSLLEMVDRIAGNRDVAMSSNPFDYIQAEQATFDAIVADGANTLPEMLAWLRQAENYGLREYIMAAACSEITGVGVKNGTGDANWATAGEWLALYDSHSPDLRRVYAMYYDLPITKGLEVYAWSMARNTYRCVLMSGTNRDKTMEEIMALPGISLDAMRQILSSYDNPAENVFVSLVHHPISSYYEEYTDADVEQVRLLLGVSERQAQYRLVIDSASWDIDGDGVEETCTLSYGPTSGLFTFVLTVSQEGQVEYRSTFLTGWCRLSFGHTGLWGSGDLCVIGEGQTDSDEQRMMLISIEDGQVVLTENGERLPSWGQ